MQGQEATVRTGHGTTDWFQIGKGIHQGCIFYFHSAHLTYMKSSSCVMPDWMKHKLEPRLLGEISITLGLQMTPPYGRKWRDLKSLLKVKEESEKVALKFNIQQTKIMASNLITSWKIDGKTMETVTDFVFWDFQNHCRWWLQPLN